jgi:hypothetical protein
MSSTQHTIGAYVVDQTNDDVRIGRIAHVSDNAVGVVWDDHTEDYADGDRGADVYPPAHIVPVSALAPALRRLLPDTGHAVAYAVETPDDYGQEDAFAVIDTFVSAFADQDSGAFGNTLARTINLYLAGRGLDGDTKAFKSILASITSEAQNMDMID